MTLRTNGHKLNGFLDQLASRVGIVLAIGLLVSICIGAGIYVQGVVVQLEENHSAFRDRETRNGYVAMSDIQRLILVAQRASQLGQMTPELANDFHSATDILFVRADSFHHIMSDEINLPSGDLSVAALTKILNIADDAIANDYPEVQVLVEDLLVASAEARRHLVQFLDDMRREADDVLENQSIAVREQQLLVLGNLVGLTVVGSVALLLLRREVLGRRRREQAEQRVEFLAFFDPLTTLPNRTQFQDCLQNRLDLGQPLSLMFVDLDDFKLINDTYGHLAGDAVLQHVGNILSSFSVRSNGFAARLGGDEFAMVVPSDDLDLLTTLCTGIISEISEPFTHSGETIDVGLCIGLAATTQVGAQQKLSIDLLTRITDFALYRSKASGKRCYTIYDRTLEQRFWERQSMIQELPKAIENGQLEIHLQPKISLRDQTVYGFEALVRWRRQDKLVLPGEFILVAEESGLVVEIDHYVLDHSTKIVADWNRLYGTDFSVSVNLSALHFNSQRIVQWVKNSLENSRLSPDLLALEITETMEMRDWKQAQAVISELKNVGSRISIDDFGTGFSSLAYLRTMNADELKIDRSLVEELETSEKARLMLASVLDIARNLELEVVIEGIETKGQTDILLNMGAVSGQGFYFGRPLPTHEALNAAMSKQCLGKTARAS